MASQRSVAHSWMVTIRSIQGTLSLLLTLSTDSCLSLLKTLLYFLRAMVLEIMAGLRALLLRLDYSLWCLAEESSKVASLYTTSAPH